MATEFDTSTHWGRCLKHMYDAITKEQLWDWLKDFEPEAGKGFMFTTHENMRKVGRHINDNDGHSGASYGCCWRVMQSIAKERTKS